MILKHTTFYTKFSLFGNISLRFFYHFKDKPKLENNWVIKDHLSGEFSVIREGLAERMLEEFKEATGKYPKREEIVGYVNEDDFYYKKELSEDKWLEYIKN